MSASSEVVITTYAERPEYIPRVYDMEDAWPELMSHDAVANALLWQVVPAFPELCAVATVDQTPVARARAIPFRLHSEDREVLPDGGWDRVLVWGMDDRIEGVRPDTVSALEVAVDPAYHGQGLSGRMLETMRDAARARGFSELVAPIRPTEKHREPHVPLAEYAARTREDGLPVDAWMRTHVRMGATIDRVAPASMVIAGSLDSWRSWTGLPFDRSGQVVVPFALVPVVCDVENDYAVYVEPNLWLRHAL